MSEDFRAVGARLSNWGRWGAEDEIGTLNHLTPGRIQAATALARTGQVISLAIPFAFDGPQQLPRTSSIGRINPVHLMTAIGVGQDYPGGFQFADDYIFMPLQCGTQWDSHAHVFYDDLIYNGHSAVEHLSPAGATRGSVHNFRRGIIGRGVLLDIAALHGVEWLSSGDAISARELDDACDRQGVEVGAGDIVLVRTGWRRKLLTDRSTAEFMRGEPGLGLDCAAWLRERDVAAVCADNWGIEVVRVDADGREHGEDQSLNMTVHMVLLRDVGMPLGELFDLEELASACAEDGRWDFLFCAPPLPIPGAVGSPVNPIAIR